MRKVPKITDDVISTRDASIELAISEQRVSTLLRSGALEGRQMGKQWFTTNAAVEAYQLGGATKPPEDR